jgi:peptide/nickel transport system substrate-binding protein
MRDRLKPLIALLIALALLVAACGSDGDSGGTGEGQENGEAPVDAAPAGEYPRDETLYTGGTQWGPPSNWNPMRNWDYATGTVNLLYETLFVYDPMEDTFTPWLAESGDPTDPASWPSDDVYEVTLKEGITWSDGEPLTAEDVKFSIDLAEQGGPYADVANWVEGVEAVDERTVQVTFAETHYQQWANWLFQNAIVPKHLWEDRAAEDIFNGANEDPVGSGPYLYETHDQDRMVWVKNDDWWGKDPLGLDPKPKYIVDIVNSSNNVALGLVLQGGVDLNNNFLPGISRLIQGGYPLRTYYPEPPYMLPANTAWLFLNTTRAPMDDAAFRRALAFSIDMNKIVKNVYGDLVLPANPTGLLPIWDKYVDQSVVDELGFSYDPAEARKLLADAGYEDGDGDGFVENTDGSPMKLSIRVPNGWSDWMEAINVISESAKAVGINLQTEFPTYDELVAARTPGDFDMVIANDRQVSNTPFTYYDYLFHLPVNDTTTSTLNYGRYENEKAWNLAQELDRTPVNDIEGMQAIISDLSEIFLEDLPTIPLWYNGAWSQASEDVWTGWPAEDGANIYPVTWRNFWQMGSIYMLDQLELTPQEEE